uniref:Gsp_35 putative toxin n=1 Tax=Gemmula speciosa TaxID=439592 RepID=A0A098LXU1_GEMSP
MMWKMRPILFILLLLVLVTIQQVLGRMPRRGRRMKSMRQKRWPDHYYCVVPKDPGTGNNPQLFWYYDLDINECRRFTYHGEGGNGNRFQKFKECTSECYDFERECDEEDYPNPYCGSD